MALSCRWDLPRAACLPDVRGGAAHETSALPSRARGRETQCTRQGEARQPTTCLAGFDNRQACRKISRDFWSARNRACRLNGSGRLFSLVGRPSLWQWPSRFADQYSSMRSLRRIPVIQRRRTWFRPGLPQILPGGNARKNGPLARALPSPGIDHLVDGVLAAKHIRRLKSNHPTFALLSILRGSGCGQQNPFRSPADGIRPASITRV